MTITAAGMNLDAILEWLLAEPTPAEADGAEQDHPTRASLYGIDADWRPQFDPGAVAALDVAARAAGLLPAGSRTFLVANSDAEIDGLIVTADLPDGRRGATRMVDLHRLDIDSLSGPELAAAVVVALAGLAESAHTHTATAAGGFPMTVPQPHLTEVIPPAAAAGTIVTVTGSGFAAANLAVDFGDRPGFLIEIKSDREIRCRVPLITAGVCDVRVTTHGGAQVLPRGFTCLPAGC